MEFDQSDQIRAGLIYYTIRSTPTVFLSPQTCNTQKWFLVPWYIIIKCVTYMTALELLLMIWKENVSLLVIFSSYLGSELGLCGVIPMFNGTVYLFFDGTSIYNREKIYLSFRSVVLFRYSVPLWYIYTRMFTSSINELKKNKLKSAF